MFSLLSTESCSFLLVFGNAEVGGEMTDVYPSYLSASLDIDDGREWTIFALPWSVGAAEEDPDWELLDYAELLLVFDVEELLFFSLIL